ncbi:MAG: ATP-binding cassette domain-containing protein [Colwellia sp.]|nr:ATP-binding cassette domain-containing protein [Colwellia sp.]
MNNLLTLKNVNLTFGDTIVFECLNFTLAEKQITTIKTGVLDGGTSFLKLCNSTLTANSGELLYENQPSKYFSNTDLFKFIGMQFESEGLLSMYTVLGNCKLPLIFHSNLDDESITNRILAAAEQFSLSHILNKYPFQLNDVQSRLANLLRLLVIKPKILLLDEIQSGMSDQIRDMLMRKLAEYIEKNDCSLIMTVTAGDRNDFADQRYQILNKNLMAY